MWFRVSLAGVDERDRIRGIEEEALRPGKERTRGKVRQLAGNPNPQEIAKSLWIKRDMPLVIYPSEPKKLVVEVEG